MAKKKSSKKLQPKEDKFLLFMEEFTNSLFHVSLFILLFRAITTFCAALVFRGSWRIVIQYNFLPVIAFSERVEEFKVINAFSILFLAIVIFLIYLKRVLQKSTTFTQLSGWYAGVIMSCITLYINFYLSQFDNFGIDFDIQYFIIGLFFISSLLFVFKSQNTKELSTQKPSKKKPKKTTKK